MNMPHLTRARQELVTLPFAVPGGRHVTAELIALPSVPAGPMPTEPHSLQVVVEVRDTPDGEFEQVAVSAVLPQFREGRAEVTVPTPDEPVPYGVRPAVARLRLIHVGTLPPLYELRVRGL